MSLFKVSKAFDRSINNAIVVFYYLGCVKSYQVGPLCPVHNFILSLIRLLSLSVYMLNKTGNAETK